MPIAAQLRVRSRINLSSRSYSISVIFSGSDVNTIFCLRIVQFQLSPPFSVFKQTPPSVLYIATDDDSCRSVWLKINYCLVKSSDSCPCLYLATQDAFAVQLQVALYIHIALPGGAVHAILVAYVTIGSGMCTTSVYLPCWVRYAAWMIPDNPNGDTGNATADQSGSDYEWLPHTLHMQCIAGRVGGHPISHM